jgi:hypothetical protein
MGPLAGIAGMITRDLWRDSKAFRDLPAESLVKSGPNVEGTQRVIAAQLYQKFAAGMKDLKPGFTGMSDRQLTAIDNVVREVSTGDAIAKSAADGFRAAADAGVSRAHQAGKVTGSFGTSCKLVDRDYRKSFDRIQQRQQKAAGGGFFWSPGESAPSRPPQFGGQ